MSGWVKDKYCKARIVLLYKVALGRGPPSKAKRLVEEAIGELKGFASSILILPKRSRIYRFWDNNNPIELGKTSTPRKKFKLPKSFMAKSSCKWRSRSSMTEGWDAVTINHPHLLENK